MLMATPCDWSRDVNASLVNCTPWSVLKISGRRPANASSKASTQNVVSKLFDNRHEST
jgi:hypothetical protein